MIFIEDLSYLALDLASKSLSSREIVLTLPDTIEAVRTLAEQHVAVTGWEGWYLHPDGKKGHAGHRSDYPGRLENETWPDFVRRAARDCLDTAQRADTHLKLNQEHSSLRIYFCLSVCAEYRSDTSDQDGSPCKTGGPGAESNLTCPCCGYKTLGEREAWEVCRVCFWEDEPLRDPYRAAGGPNASLSLCDAQQKYLALRASGNWPPVGARPPKSTDVVDPHWRPLPPPRTR